MSAAFHHIKYYGILHWPGPKSMLCGPAAQKGCASLACWLLNCLKTLMWHVAPSTSRLVVVVIKHWYLCGRLKFAFSQLLPSCLQQLVTNMEHVLSWISAKVTFPN